MRLKKLTAWGLICAMTLGLSMGVTAETGAIDTSLTTAMSKEGQIAMATGEGGQLPGTKRTFFNDDNTIYDWFNVGGYAADGVQDRSQYYDEYVANGRKNTANYVVVEEDGYWNSAREYITTAQYNALSEDAKKAYRVVTAEEQFTRALAARPRVIQVNAEELELGWHYLADRNIFSGPIDATTDYDSGKKAPPITNPVIMHEEDEYLQDGVKAMMADSQITKGTGVSDIKLYDHMTIFSTTGCMIRHAGLDINGYEDIIVRNFQFEGMYEWDDQTEEICKELDFTTRKRYGWGYFSVKNSENIWIDHCTFGFAFDGNDITDGSSCSITWCKFGVQDFSHNNETPVSITKVTDGKPEYSGTRWFESKGSELWKSILFMEEVYQKYKNGLLPEKQQYHYYTKYRNQGATPQELLRYAAMHSKVHLTGGTGEDEFYTSVDGRLTLGFNYYTNVIQRIPMVRTANAHMYNCIVDNEEYQAATKAIKAKGVGIGYTSSISVNNARNGATIGTDTCIFNDVTPCTGAETQGLDPGNVKAEWLDTLECFVNHNLVVNSKVTTGGETYVGSNWDNNGENLFNKKWKWGDKSSIGDFKWGKWKSLEEFRNAGALNTKAVAANIQNYTKKNGRGAFYKNYYIGEANLGYNYQCFDLDKVEEMLGTYGGALKDLYGSNGTMKDYIQPYNEKSTPIEEGQLGDVDGNGKIEMADAIGILKYMAKMSDGNFDETLADVDGNGKVEMADAIGILKYMAQIIKDFSEL